MLTWIRPSPPSIPSVSAASAAMPGVSAIAMASASAYSCERPPRPLALRTVTSSSPPLRIATLRPAALASCASLACACATSRASPVKLSPKEYDLLCDLALNLGRVTPHRDLLRAVWGSERAEIQYLRVYMGQLRQKLGPEHLPSTPGVGYSLV